MGKEWKGKMWEKRKIMGGCMYSSGGVEWYTFIHTLYNKTTTKPLLLIIK